MLRMNAMGEFVDDEPPRFLKLDHTSRRGPKECAACGRLFRPRTERQLYCSPDCRRDANRLANRYRRRRYSRARWGE